jgi:predicted ATP-dependent endonuclease of OLD family
MKVKRIELKGYYQFEDIEINLTYPKGHKKEGRPLDKVCIIGQSGTGKTSLLRVLKWFVSRDRSIGKNIKLPILPEARVTMDFEVADLYYSLTNAHTELEYQSFGRKGKGKRKMSFENWNRAFSDSLEAITPFLINYPTELIAKRELPGQDENGDLSDIEKAEKREAYLDKLEPLQIIDFAFEDVEKAWHFVLKDIREHRAHSLSKQSKIAGTAAQEDVTLQKIEKQSSEYKKWLLQNPDPLKVLADQYLDPILKKLGLKINLDINPDAILHLGFIQLKTLDDKEVPGDFWSTGTWQLVQTIIPLYQLKPKHAVVLVDEPERSLYPDFQTTIIDTYTGLAPECQFFFATHSPMIASCFEPWEIIELKFDEQNRSVYQELHYDGDNHVNNYKYYPEYLRWDSNLMRIFDLGKAGGKKRRQALEELEDMKTRIRELKEQKKLDSREGQELVDKYLALSDRLDWRIEKEERD